MEPAEQLALYRTDLETCLDALTATEGWDTKTAGDVSFLATQLLQQLSPGRRDYYAELLPGGALRSLYGRTSALLSASRGYQMMSALKLSPREMVAAWVDASDALRIAVASLLEPVIVVLDAAARDYPDDLGKLLAEFDGQPSPVAQWHLARRLLVAVGEALATANQFERLTRKKYEFGRETLTANAYAHKVNEVADSAIRDLNNYLTIMESDTQILGDSDGPGPGKRLGKTAEIAFSIERLIERISDKPDHDLVTPVK